MFDAVNGTAGDDLLIFEGQLGELSMTLTNPYSGFSIYIEDEFNINTGDYQGYGGFDTLYMSNTGDALFMNDGAGRALFSNIELIRGGPGGDVIVLSDEVITLGAVFIDGAQEGDVLWGNVGNDTLRGFDGDDNLEGGPGQDDLRGGDDNDFLNGGTGADLLIGGDGDDVLNYTADGQTSEGYNQTHDAFDGGDGYDILNMTSGNDILLVSDTSSPFYSSTLQIVLNSDVSASQRVISVEEINAGAGDDIVDLSNGSYEASAVINGEQGNDILKGGEGNDTIDGGTGQDSLYGGYGNDTVYGGNGNDVLYGGNGDATVIVQDKNFVDSVVFPSLEERKNIKNLKPPGTPSLGVDGDNLTLDYDAKAEITFREGFAGYDNALGVYSIAADGTIQSARLLWNNVKDAGKDITHVVDLPTTDSGGEIGFFIFANGYNKDHRYKDMDTGTEDNIKFVYDYGGENERAATIHDSGSDITTVYDDGVTTEILRAPAYHTTARGGSTALNDDGEEHVVSGLMPGTDGETGDVFRIGFEDLPNLGDADYEDVLFDLNIVEHVTYTEGETGADILIGGNGDDVLYGEGGDDILIGGNGNDEIHGGLGSDTIVYNELVDGVDSIYGFETGEGGDSLNITDILDGFDGGDDIADFVRLIQTAGGDTEVQVNVDGDVSGEFASLAIIQGGVGGASLDTLIADGNLVVDQSIVI